MIALRQSCCMIMVIIVLTDVSANVCTACIIRRTIGGDNFNDIVSIVPLISIILSLSSGPDTVKNMEHGSRT